MSSKQLEKIWLWTTPSMVSFLKPAQALIANFKKYFQKVLNNNNNNKTAKSLAQATSYYPVKTVFPRQPFIFLFPLNNQNFTKIMTKVSFSQLNTFIFCKKSRNKVISLLRNPRGQHSQLWTVALYCDTHIPDGTACFPLNGGIE